MSSEVGMVAQVRESRFSAVRARNWVCRNQWLPAHQSEAHLCQRWLRLDFFASPGLMGALWQLCVVIRWSFSICIYFFCRKESNQYLLTGLLVLPPALVWCGSPVKSGVCHFARAWLWSYHKLWHCFCYIKKKLKVTSRLVSLQKTTSTFLLTELEVF